MQLVMKFTQAYVNMHANKLFSLSFWPVASTGGIWNLRLWPARIRMPEIETEKEKDPSLNRDCRYQEYEGQKMQITYISDSVRCSWLHARGIWWSYLRKQKAKRSGVVLSSHPTAWGKDQKSVADLATHWERRVDVGCPRAFDVV